MKQRRKALMAGIAALALIAGTGLAAAQEHSKDQVKEPHAASQPPAAQRMSQGTERNGGATTQKSNRSAEEMKGASKTQAGQHRAQAESHKKGAEEGASAQTEKAKGPRAAERRTSRENTPATHQAEEHHRMGREKDNGKIAAERNRAAHENKTARQGRNRLEGLQANASGVNVRINDEQRTRIRRTVIDARGAPRVGHVNFDVRVGTIIPRHDIRIVPVPRTLVRIEPEWHGFLYFVYEDEVVIVNPRDMRIVAVLPV